jgi:hypothetical protein
MSADVISFPGDGLPDRSSPLPPLAAFASAAAISRSSTSMTIASSLF